jgi:hypothetical protein
VQVFCSYAVGAILRFGISTVSTHGVASHTIGDILMLVGVLGVVLWMVVWAPWSRSAGSAYRDEPPAYRDEPPAWRDEPPAYREAPVYREERSVYREDPYQDVYRR